MVLESCVEDFLLLQCNSQHMVCIDILNFLPVVLCLFHDVSSQSEWCFRMLDEKTSFHNFLINWFYHNYLWWELFINEWFDFLNLLLTGSVTNWSSLEIFLALVHIWGLVIDWSINWLVCVGQVFVSYSLDWWLYSFEDWISIVLESNETFLLELFVVWEGWFIF